jgi:DNA-binding winged helix-turn-helix (wHTH) protein
MASPGDSMPPLRSQAPNLAFGPFEFDLASAELRKHGYKVKLPAQSGQVLGALVQRPGSLVTRKDLRTCLWPGVSAGDFEHGLNAAVNRLRQTLGDSADQPRYVETLPGQGYRFIAPIQRASTKAVLEMDAPAQLRI